MSMILHGLSDFYGNNAYIALTKPQANSIIRHSMYLV
jgi:hypothetical protein